MYIYLVPFFPNSTKRVVSSKRIEELVFGSVVFLIFMRDMFKGHSMYLSLVENANPELAVPISMATTARYSLIDKRFLSKETMFPKIIGISKDNLTEFKDWFVVQVRL